MFGFLSIVVGKENVGNNGIVTNLRSSAWVCLMKGYRDTKENTIADCNGLEKINKIL